MKHKDPFIQNAQKALGLRISRLREKKKLTQAQLAANCNMSLHRIKKIESGEGAITYLDMAAIAGELRISLYRLLKGIA